MLLRRFWPAVALLLAGLAAAPAAHAQGLAPRRYFIYFTDKNNSPYSVAQPQQFLSARSLARRSRQGIAVRPRDLPVNPAYVAQVRAVSGAPTVLYTSRWLNGALLGCDSLTYQRVLQLPVVKAGRVLSYRVPQAARPNPPVQPLPAARTSSSDRATYGLAYTQNAMIGSVAAQQAGYRGEGMQIAVFDAGFPGANTAVPLQLLQTQNRVASTRNFVDGGTSVYLRNSHGTNTLGLMAGELPGTYIGTAPHATFRLYITEDATTESPVEEANWLAAAEAADSAGVDVISSSLGYTTFDRAALNHTYADLNGRTAIGSLAALGAARAGMVVCNSAGNDGANAWHYVSVPADADSIISVGAVDSLRQHAYFSSYGPTADGRLKPTLDAMGVLSAVITASGSIQRGNGTSYSCPELAGMVATFWQANPSLTAQQVIAALVRSGSQYATPDNTLGYGIPNFVTAYNLLHPATPLASTPATATPEALSIFPNPTHGNELTLSLPPALRGQALVVRVLDARGAAVAQQLVPAGAGAAVPLALPARGLAPGAYSCTVRRAAGGASQAVRFVQQ